jgi:ribosomal protein L37AE/L43A
MPLLKIHSAWHVHTLTKPDLFCKVCSNSLSHKRLSVKINRCSLCGLNIDVHQWSGGCYCIPLNADGLREQENPFAPKPSYGKSSESKYGHTLDYIDEFYDGYGFYDVIRRNIEQEEF